MNGYSLVMSSGGFYVKSPAGFYLSWFKTKAEALVFISTH